MRGAVKLRFAGAVFAALVLLSGCVGGRTITMDLNYDPARLAVAPFEGAQKLKVALVPFNSSPTVSDTLGKWVGFRGKQDLLKTSAPPDAALTRAVYAYMQKAGFEVTLAPQGASVQSYSEGSSDIVMGGTVEDLRMDALSKFGSTSLTASFKMKVLLKNSSDGSLLTVNVEGASEPRTVVAFDSGVFAETVNTMVSDSVEKIFKGLVVKDGVLRPAK